jgi:hypothetical protein
MQATSQINIRLDPEAKALLEKVARDRGEDVSSFVRRAIKIELARLSFLSPEEKKALGVRLESSSRRGRKLPVAIGPETPRVGIAT